MDSSQNTLFKYFQLSALCRGLVKNEKDNKESCRELTFFSVQAQSKGMLALYLFWINVRAVMMVPTCRKVNQIIWVSHLFRKIFESVCMRANKAII